MRWLALFGTMGLALFATSRGGSGLSVNPQVVAVQSTLLTTLLGPLVLALALAFPRPAAPASAPDARPVGLLRRLGAHLIDFFVVLVALAPLGAFAGLLLEAAWAGTFRWAFVRTDVTARDALFALPVVLVLTLPPRCPRL